MALVVENFHVPSPSPPCNRLPDPAKAVNPEGFTGEVLAQKHQGVPTFEFPRPNHPLALGNSPCAGKKKGPGDIRGGFGQYFRCVGDPYSLFLRGLKVDIVVTHREIGDALEQGGRLKDFPGDRVGKGGKKGVVRPDPGRQPGFPQGFFVPCDMVAPGKGAVSRGWDGAGDQDAFFQGLPRGGVRIRSRE